MAECGELLANSFIARIKNLYKGRSSHYHHLFLDCSFKYCLSLLLLLTPPSSCCPGLAVSVCHPLCSHPHSCHTSKPQPSPSLIQGKVEPETPSPIHNVREKRVLHEYVCMYVLGSQYNFVGL